LFFSHLNLVYINSFKKSSTESVIADEGGDDEKSSTTEPQRRVNKKAQRLMLSLGFKSSV